VTTRLDTQRPPASGKTHTRKNSRWDTRGYDNTPHPVWGDTQVVSIPGGFATGATAGAPGSFTPAGATIPASVQAMQANNPVPVIPSPFTTWSGTQYVQTATAGAPGQASWNGFDWVVKT